LSYNDSEKLFGLRDGADGDAEIAAELGHGVFVADIDFTLSKRGDRRGHVHELEVAGFEILNELFHGAGTRTVAEPTGRCNRRDRAARSDGEFNRR
jgi:hypothetical protein